MFAAGFGPTEFPPLTDKIRRSVGVGVAYPPARFEVTFGNPQDFVYALVFTMNLSPTMPYPFVLGQIWPIGL